MRLSRWALACCLVSLLLAGGCRRQAEDTADSPLVKRVEAAGAGRLSGLSPEAIAQWLRRHRDIANEVNGACAPLRKTAAAQWAESTEGRLCAVAAVTVFTNPGLRKRDGKGFDATF